MKSTTTTPPIAGWQAEAGDIDYYLFTGKQVLDVTKAFVRLTGKTLFGPKWSLGYSGSTMHYTDAPDAQNQLMNFIRLCEQHAIPCDSFQLSSGYTSINGKRYVFNWNYDKVPQPKVMSQSFHDAGLKLAANIKPCLLQDHPALWRSGGARPVYSRFANRRAGAVQLLGR